VATTSVQLAQKLADLRAAFGLSSDRYEAVDRFQTTPPELPNSVSEIGQTTQSSDTSVPVIAPQHPTSDAVEPTSAVEQVPSTPAAEGPPPPFATPEQVAELKSLWSMFKRVVLRRGGKV